MKIKPKKEDGPEDESLPYLQGTSVGSISFVEITTKKPVRKIKGKPQIGFIRDKKNERNKDL